MRHPAPDTTHADDGHRPVDSLDDVRLLLPLLRDLPNPAASAAALLASFGSLARAVHASPAHLAACDPALDAAAPRFREFADLHGALLRAELVSTPLYTGQAFTSVETARRFVATAVGNRDREVLGALVLTTRLHLMRDVVLAEGTYDRAAVYVREVARLVLDHPTPGIILYHGHPSGDPTPSHSDWALTEAVRDALATLHASLFDHLVCAGAATVSMAQLDPDKFDPCDGRARYIVDE
ncbi:MAG: hypothetical protein OXH75_25500 [Acidobacteria bacterium]|nr:hypothetical protein [Acidobacteriota bacterium]